MQLGRDSWWLHLLLQIPPPVILGPQFPMNSVAAWQNRPVTICLQRDREHALYTCLSVCMSVCCPMVLLFPPSLHPSLRPPHTLGLHVMCLMCCSCLDSAETIRSVLNAASHRAPLWLVCQHRLDFNRLLKCDSVYRAAHSNPTRISWIGESKLIRFEQAVQMRPVLTDTPISGETEGGICFRSRKAVCPFKHDAHAAAWQIPISFLLLSKQEKEPGSRTCTRMKHSI